VISSQTNTINHNKFFIYYGEKEELIILQRKAKEVFTNKEIENSEDSDFPIIF